jgi:hypothetical protein
MSGNGGNAASNGGQWVSGKKQPHTFGNPQIPRSAAAHALLSAACHAAAVKVPLGACCVSLIPS